MTRRYWRTRGKGKIGRGLMFERESRIGTSSFLGLFFSCVGFLDRDSQMACSQRPILAALGENGRMEKGEGWQRERRERRRAKTRRGRPEWTPSNGPIESSIGERIIEDYGRSLPGRTGGTLQRQVHRS